MFAGDLRYRTQQLPAKPAKIAASILYFASIRSFFKATRKGYTGASFYLMTTAANYTKIGEHLSLSYQAHKRHIQYSLCLSLEQKTLCYRSYFEARLNLFAKAILCLDDPGMQVIFSGDVVSTRRILPTLQIRR